MAGVGGSRRCLGVNPLAIEHGSRSPERAGDALANVRLGPYLYKQFSLDGYLPEQEAEVKPMNISMENAVPSAVGALIALAVWPILRSAICFLLLHLPGSWRFRVLWRLLQIDRRRSNRLFAQHGGDRKERADIMNEQLVLLAPVLIEKPDLLLPDGGKFLPDK